MRRVFIVWPCNFPHGGALANYIECLAKALAEAGYEVTLFAFCDIDSDYCKQYSFRIEDISSKYENSFFKRIFEGRLLPFRCACKLLKIKLRKSDLIITRQVSGMDSVMLFLKKLYGFKTCTCPLEWFPKEFFNTKTKWQESEREFIRNKKHDLILPISRNIDNQFVGHRSLILPPMVDTSMYYQSSGLLAVSIKFIFSANGAMKDSIGNMLKGIELLSDEEISKSVFHFTGVKEEKAKKIIGENRWNYLKNHMFFHKWMEYDELKQLYGSCHYLYLARGINQMTLSNFPSKIPEVMAMGIVPVVSHVGDYTDLYLKDGVDSIFIDGDSAEACCAALHKSIINPPEKYKLMSQASRITAETRFDYRNWTQKLKNIIESLYE